MGCCATNEQNSELQFQGMEAYETAATIKGSKITGNRSTNPSDSSYTQKGISQIGSQVQIKPQNLSQTHRGNPNNKYNDDQRVLLTLTWLSYQQQPVQNQRTVNTNIEPQNTLPPKSVSFNHTNPRQNSQRIHNFAQNAHWKIRFGPLSTINQEESQLGQTVRLSDLGSRAEINNTYRSNFQE